MAQSRPSSALRWRRIVIIVAAILIAIAAVAAFAAGVPARGAVPATAWAPTSTKALSLVNATPAAKPAASTPLRLTIGLTPHDTDALHALIQAQSDPSSSSYGQFLTADQFTDRFAASPAAAQAVTSYLAGTGMTNIAVASNRLQVTADATVAQAEQAFNTTIAAFTQGGQQVLANTSDALVPAALAGTVSGVLGLSTLGMHAAPQVSAPKLTGYYPKEFTTVYNAGGTKAGDGTTLAVIAEGDLTQTVKDLRTAEKAQGLPQVPVTLVNTGPASPDTAGAGEWDLDTQTSTGVAPNAKRLYIYIATSLTNSDLARSINAFVSQNVARSGSASLGECDILPFLDGSMVIDDIAFAEAAVQGQTFFASTGDTGSSCAVAPTNGVPGAGLPDTEYPASSTYVTAVGGTTLITDAKNTYTNEIAWNAGGGGISPVATSGYWQNGVVPTAAAGLRGLPDVAFDADPTTGAQIYVSGAPEQIGGTSLSSPLALGLWTRLQSSHGNKLGFAPPKLYALYTAAQKGSATPPTSVPGFHDIVVGSNGAYTALPGYDFTTGLGSWDVTALSKVLH